MAPTRVVMTVEPTAEPTAAPDMTAEPTAAPTVALTGAPTVALTAEPTVPRDARGGPHAQVRPALSRCLDVDVEEFAATFWGERPHVSTTGGFDDLFSAEAIDELLTHRGLRTPFLRMARDGTVLPESRYTASGGAGARIGDQVDAAAVYREMNAGATLVLQGLHRTWEPVRTFARQLVLDLGHPVQVNAYITPAGSQGFASHYDTHDVLVLQIAGTKAWRMHEPVVAHPERSWENVRDRVAQRAQDPPYLERDLVPGDCLYLPRGWLHSAAAQQDLTIHLTIGIHALTAADVLRHAARRARTNPALRANLPLGVTADPGELAAAIAPVLKQAAGDLAEVDPDSLARDLLADLDAAARPEPIAPLRQLRAADSLGPESRVRLPHGSRATVHPEGDRVLLTAAGRQVGAPAQCRDALTLIATGATVAPSELPGLDPVAGVTLVRRLLDDAMVVPVEQ